MNPNKKFLQSKKCISYLILMVSGVGIILSAILTGQPEDVTVEALRTLGLAIGAASATLIGGQSFVDSSIAKKSDK